MPVPCQLTGEEKNLKADIIRSLQNQGFQIEPHLRPPGGDKQSYRGIQRAAKLEQAGAHRKFITSFTKHAAKLVGNGWDIDPENISLELREVQPRSFNAMLFRWWNLVWWSMPYQHPYGRQMRFFLWDTHHDLPFGMFLLQSPLLRFAARDQFLGIPRDELDHWANMSLNAQRVGALPPYNRLIGGKMAALAMTSNEVRERYRSKYGERTTLMLGRRLRADLLFITTTSAFGKSSMYDRLRYDGRLAAVPIGYTKGMGTFHLSDSLTNGLYGVLRRRGVDTSTSYGNGPSRKLKLFKLAFEYLGLEKFYSHGIRRQVYLFPLTNNLDGVIHRGERPAWLDRPFDDLQRYWKERWAIPRCRRMPEWKEFDSEEFVRQAMLEIKG